MTSPRVGILADDKVQQHSLRETLRQFGFDVTLSQDPSIVDRIALYQDQPLDVWLVAVNTDQDDEIPVWLDSLLAGDIPVLVGIERPPSQGCPTYPRWQKRLYQKLKELVPVPAPVRESGAVLEKLGEAASKSAFQIPLPDVLAAAQPPHLATEVWVLGASLGGPGAVKEFLDTLPSGLPVGFVYAQHIDARFESTLPQTVGRHCSLALKSFAPRIQIHPGDILVAPIANEFEFGPGFEALSCDRPWPGPYGPSIDQVILNVHARYGPRMGVILFSGMGNDGADAISSLDTSDIPVWVQTPGSCASPSMPESAQETGRVTFHGTPFQLANQLVNRLKQNQLRTNA